MKRMMSGFMLGVYRWILGGLGSVAVLVMLVSGTHFVAAQSGSCGNGLAQRLVVGMDAWVIPEPPVPVNVRDRAGGNRTTQLQPGDFFTVLAGPVCDQGYSWWQVRGSNGVSGWIAEGVDSYFVEPLAVGGTGSGGETGQGLAVVIESTTCAAAPRYAVGDSVRVTENSPATFYGHPLIENGLFPTAAIWSFHPDLQDSDYLLDDYIQRIIGVEAFIIDGPYCVNGTYLYKVGTLGRLSILRSYYYSISSYPSFWLDEKVLVVDAAVPIGNVELREMKLYDEAAPIVDISSQLAFSISGGGAPSFPLYWSSERCALGDMFTSLGYEYVTALSESLISYPKNPCMAVFPLDTGQAVVRLVQPDGQLYSETEMTVQPMVISERVQTNGLYVDVPRGYDAASGIWTIEVVTAEGTTRRAYHLAGEYEGLIAFCEGAHQRFVINAAHASRKYDLVHIAIDPQEADYRDTLLYYSAYEVNRWTVETSPTGDLLLDLQFVPEQSGLMVLVEEGGDWMDYIDHDKEENYRRFTTAIISCTDPFLVGFDPEIGGEIVPDRLVTGSRNFTFPGRSGDIISLAGHLHERDIEYIEFSPLDVAFDVTLTAPDGTVIARQNEVFTLNLKGVTLPQAGIYTIAASASDSSKVPAFILHFDHTALLEATIAIGETVHASLTDTNRWVFSAQAGEEIVVDVRSGDFDVTLTLRDAVGTEIAFDDDGGAGLDARLIFTAPTEGFYVIEIGAWNDKRGEYGVEISR